MRVVSWQQSGVAFAPWRYRRCIVAADPNAEISLTAVTAGLESYGLGEVDEILPNVLDAARGADILHLHHAYASSELIPVLRDAFPRLKIVVTLHGEPDRSVVGKPCEFPPDAYHLVEPGLARIATNAMATFIPNHPATEPIPIERNPSTKPQLLIPFSHVAQWKDGELAEAVAEKLEALGWVVFRAPKRLPNEDLRRCIAAADAVWVQMQGYFDLLTMECWQAGTLPIVLAPGRDHSVAWASRLGFAPLAPFRIPDVAAIVAVLQHLRWRDTIPVNRAGMRECWTPGHAGAQWLDFYRGVLAA